MTGQATLRPWPLSLVSCVSIALVAAGVLLTGVSWWFLLISAAGAYGPGLLREFGYLHDRDEFQRMAAYRAGYHAYLISGILAMLLVAFFRASDLQFNDLEELATLFLTSLSFTWLLSSLIGFWGAQKSAYRFLLTFGIVWLAFTILSNTGSEWRGWLPLLLHPLLAIPFFILAILSLRLPRLAGTLLLVSAVALTWFFQFFQRDNSAIINQAIVFILFIGPLIASGVALLSTSTLRSSSTHAIDDDNDDEDESDDDDA